MGLLEEDVCASPRNGTSALSACPTCTRSLTATAPSSAATLNSSFFQKIPAEVRRIILAAAFGGRTLHMDLRRVHPRKKRERDDDADGYRENLAERCYQDTTKPASWRWVGFVCHHHRLDRDRSPEGPGYEEPYYDLCIRGLRVDECCQSSRHAPHKCFIGAMGWLRSCRQAYADGIDVLYEVNTFHMRGSRLLRQPRDFILPQRLAAIKSLELVLQIQPFRDFANPPTEIDPLDLNSYLRVIEALPECFPNLRFLYLALCSCLCPLAAEARIGVAPALVAPVDRALRRLRRLVQCRVILPVPLMIMLRCGQETVRPIRSCYFSETKPLWRELTTDSELQGTLTASHVKG